MKYIIGIVLVMFCNLSHAVNGSLNLAIPNSPGSYLSDRFRSGEMDCSMAIGSGVNVEFGVVGVMTNNDTNTIATASNFAPQSKDVGVYARMIIPIGMPKGRVDCTTLYDIELRRKAIEIEKLELELRNLRNMKFEK
jgi:hypothetical protein